MSTQHAASGIPKFSPEQLAYLATLNSQNNPILKAILKGTDPIAALMAESASNPAAVKPSEAVALPTVGDVVADRGVYLGTWEAAKGHTVHAYAEPDFLRKPNGEQLLMTFNEARDEFAKRNGGRLYGDGTELDVRQAIKTGAYHEGDWGLPPKELLNGYDVQGNLTRPEGNIYTLMNKGALPKVAAAVQNGEGDQRWALSGSEHPDHPSSVAHVRLTDGAGGWGLKYNFRSGVVPVRYYQNGPSAPQLTPGG